MEKNIYIFTVPPSSPHKGATAEVPEEDFEQRPQIKIFSNEGTWIRNVKMCKRITGQKGLSPRLHLPVHQV